MGAEPLTFCTSFLSLRQFVVERHGKNAWTDVRDRLAADGHVLPAVITPGSWLPTRAFVAGLHAGRDLYKEHDFAPKLGAAAAEYEVKWVHRVVLRFTSPLWLLERGADVWKSSHTTGRWTIESPKPRTLKGTLHDFGVVDMIYCDSLRAWLKRACRMTGADEIEIRETRCRDRDGAGACVFEGSW